MFTFTIGLTLGIIAGVMIGLSVTNVKRFVWIVRNGRPSAQNHPAQRSADEITFDANKRDAMIAELNVNFDDIRAKARAARAARAAL